MSGSAGMPRPISYAVFCLKKELWPVGLRRETSICCKLYLRTSLCIRKSSSDRPVSFAHPTAHPTRHSSDIFGDIPADVLATDNHIVGMGDAGHQSAILGSYPPNPDVAVPSFVSG